LHPFLVCEKSAKAKGQSIPILPERVAFSSKGVNQTQEGQSANGETDCSLSESAKQVADFVNSEETQLLIFTDKLFTLIDPTTTTIVQKVGEKSLYAVNAEGRLIYLGREVAKSTAKAISLGTVLARATNVLLLVFTPTSLGTGDTFNSYPFAGKKVEGIKFVPNFNMSVVDTNVEPEPYTAPIVDNDRSNDDGKKYLVYIAKRNYKKCVKKVDGNKIADYCLKYVGISTVSPDNFIGPKGRYQLGDIQATDFFVIFTNLKKGEARGVEQEIIELNNVGEPYSPKYPQFRNKQIDNIANSTSPLRDLTDGAYTSRKILGTNALNRKYPKWQSPYIDRTFVRGGFKFTGTEYQGDPNCNCNP
jgi:hypothetical protein